MEIQLSQPSKINGSPSSSSSSSSSTNRNPNPNPNPNSNANPNSMQSWWESISKARSRIQALSAVLPPADAASLSVLADSDRPARALLDSPEAFKSISSALSAPLSGAGNDLLCQWLYETFQSSDPDLRLIVLSFLPLLSGVYLSRVVASPDSNLAGFEAVLLSIYASEAKLRGGRPVLVSIPDLSQPSLYHSPLDPRPAGSPSVGVLSAPLEPHVAVKSTKRASIVAVTLDCYFKSISLMPSQSKIDLCEFATAWAGQNCSCPSELERGWDCSDGNNLVSFSSEIKDFQENGDIQIESVEEEMGKLAVGGDSPKKANVGSGPHCLDADADAAAAASVSTRGVRVPLPWELFQPVLRIIGHCLLAPLNPQEVKDAASVAVRRLYARALHDLLPQAILATRSLIQLDKRTRLAAEAVAANAASNANTPTKPKKPEILLVSK